MRVLETIVATSQSGDQQSYLRLRNCAEPCNCNKGSSGRLCFSDRAWQLFPDSQLIPPTCPDAAEWSRWRNRLGTRSAGRVWRWRIRQERARNRGRHNNKRNQVPDGLREGPVVI